MDSQSVKTTEESGRIKVYDGGKQVKGRKRHVLVDTLGLLLVGAAVSVGIMLQSFGGFQRRRVLFVAGLAGGMMMGLLL